MPKIIGFGSLLSETSARSTFGDSLKNFHLGRVKGYRRVFAHPASVFFVRGIANLETKEIASLSTEKSENDTTGFIVSVFDIPDSQSSAFREREEEFKIVDAEYQSITSSKPCGDSAWMCSRWTDEEYKEHYGEEQFQKLYGDFGLQSIWGWDRESGILPCRVYLRHCVLSVQKLGQDVYNDFLDNTFLADRTTSIRQYLQQKPEIMEEGPPAHLVGRYSG